MSTSHQERVDSENARTVLDSAGFSLCGVMLAMISCQTSFLATFAFSASFALLAVREIRKKMDGADFYYMLGLEWARTRRRSGG